MTIHWCGAGPLAVPGLRRLIVSGHEVTVWTRSLDRAEDAVGDLTQRLHEFEPETLAADVAPDDVLVSLLPDAAQPALADIALSRGAHFVCASPLEPALRRLHARTQIKGLCLLGEVGLAPGVDHLLAHALVADYRRSGAYDPGHALSFSSWCGVLPERSTAFRHKFHGPALRELCALRQPSRSIRDFVPLTMARPWEALLPYEAPLPQPERFEVFPIGDAISRLETYAFDPTWRIRDFACGTLHLHGWAEAWRVLLHQIAATASDPSDACGDPVLRDLAAKLDQDHSFAPGEPDRVVLCVSLRAEGPSGTVWHRTRVLDARGDARGSALARLTSVPVSLAVQAVMARLIPVGVSAAPGDIRLVHDWLDVIRTQAQHFAETDHLD